MLTGEFVVGQQDNCRVYVSCSAPFTIERTCAGIRQLCSILRQCTFSTAESGALQCKGIDATKSPLEPSALQLQAQDSVIKAVMMRTAFYEPDMHASMCAGIMRAIYELFLFKRQRALALSAQCYVPCGGRVSGLCMSHPSRSATCMCWHLWKSFR